VSQEKTEFAEFFQASWEPCLRAVAASTGSVQLAEDQVAEAFARAWLSWRKVRQALTEHGIPALVTAGQFCRTADQPPPGSATWW
jgi:hypothetical protein